MKALRLLTAGKYHRGRSYISLLLDDFTIAGPNGNHLCIITEAAGRSIAHTKDEYSPFKFPVTVAREISAQALLALEYIHSCGVIHAGIYLQFFKILVVYKFVIEVMPSLTIYRFTLE